MQMPVFLTEPPQIQTSPSPRKQKKKTEKSRKQINVVHDCLNHDENLSLVPANTVAVKSTRHEYKQTRNQDTARSVSIFIQYISNSFYECLIIFLIFLSM